MSSLVCVDASAIVALVTGQNPAIVQKFEEWESSSTDCIAPGLIYYEVTNALYRYQFTRVLTPESVKMAMEAALALNVKLYTNSELHREAFSLAHKLSLPATYDSHYLAVAERMNTELWTADRKLYRKISKKFPLLRLFRE
jgi:predicted nucleic acid-binding protein